MTHLLLSELGVTKRRFFAGLVLLYLYAVLPTQSQPADFHGVVGPECTTFDHAGGRIDLLEGQDTNFFVHAMRSECEDPACIAANTNCTMACNGCDSFKGLPNMRVDGQGPNASLIPGLSCSIANETNGTIGYFPAKCFTGNSLAGQSGYTLVFTVQDDLYQPMTTKSATIRFVAGDVVVANCVGKFESGTVYAGSDNTFQIWLKDTYNNSVGAETFRPAITPIPFTITITSNPDDGNKVPLGQIPTVDTTGGNGYYTVNINPTKPGNYLAKIGANDVMIQNSPVAFEAVKGSRKPPSPASLIRPFFRGSGVWCFVLSVVYMAVVSIATGNLI